MTASDACRTNNRRAHATVPLLLLESPKVVAALSLEAVTTNTGRSSATSQLDQIKQLPAAEVIKMRF